MCDMATERCAPCFNPIDGSDTKACSQGCDTGPANKTPVTFPVCGDGEGVCVPPSLVTDPNQLMALQGIDDPSGKCTDTTQVCAPKLKAQNQAANFASCTSTSVVAILFTATSTGQKTACVPKYIVPMAQQSLINQDDCQTNELCAPCLNPTSTPANAPTGACPP
jgi:hypothetical protein